MAGMNVKFQIKSNRKIPTLPGTRTSTAKSQLLISSGILSLDHVLGGGFPVGNIILIEEDEFGFFARLFLKYFIAEGLVSRHGAVLSSLDTDTHHMVLELPSPVADYPRGFEETKGSGNEDGLKIAWRYKDNSGAPPGGGGANFSTTFGHHFDLASPLSDDVISSSEIHHYEHDEDDTEPYDSLLRMLSKRMASDEHSLRSGQTARRKVLRAALHSIGSPLWGDYRTSAKRLTRFLYGLRALVHTSLTTCLVTIPAHLFKEQPGLVERCEHLSDCVLRLESLAGNNNPCYSEYSGLLHVDKLSSANALAPHVPETNDWAFKLRKRRFVVEKLHLPPELGETAQREQDEGPMCGSGSGHGKSALDF